MTRRAKIWIIAVLVTLVVLALVGVLFWPTVFRQFFEPRTSSVPFAPTNNAPVAVNQATNTQAPADAPRTEVIAQNLAVPWEIAFLPDGTLLVTERDGQLVRIGTDKKVIPINGVTQQSESGLLGLALHPKFVENNLLYVYLTYDEAGTLLNRVERYKIDLAANTVSDRTVIIDKIPGSSIHDGGRLAFGPDQLLYITTGDAGDTANAQNKASLAGKILRLNDDGSLPADNPFGSAVYSYGHRNPQGITWDPAGRLWETEHGPSGGCPECGQDEVNLVEKGKNYGWPTITGNESAGGLETPKVHSGTDDTWAPSGVAYFDGSLFFAGLRGEALYEAKLSGTQVTGLVAHFRTDAGSEFGRLRTVQMGPDGFLYITTNNQDGRGTPKPGDDKVIRVNPNIFR